MKAERERELEKELERFLFDFGRQVLGKGTGGMIVKLKQAYGISSAWNQLKMAAQKSDPREYLGAILRKKPAEETGPIKVFIEVDSPQWIAWCAHRGRRLPQTYNRELEKTGWYVDTEFPAK